MIKDGEKRKLIELSELSEIIKTKDIRATIKWCELSNLPIIPIGKKKLTYRFLAEAELDKKIIYMLKKRFPEKWEELYEYYKSNNHYKYMLATENDTPSNLISKETGKLPKSQLAKDFLKE